MHQDQQRIAEICWMSLENKQNRMRRKIVTFPTSKTRISLCQMLWFYVSDLSWRNFRRYHAKGLWFKWRPNVCIWIAIPQWQSFISLLRILQDGFHYRPCCHEYHLPTKKEEDYNPAQLHALLVSLKTLRSLRLVHSRRDYLSGGIIVGEV